MLQEVETLVLRQEFAQPINGFFDNGPKSVFYWSIDCEFSDGKSRVGSWGANCYFEVATGKTDKATLGNARRALAQRARLAGKACTFSYYTTTKTVYVPNREA